MAQVPIEELLKRCGSVYRLVILAAKRAKELSEGSPPLVESPHRKATSVALEEILQGKVLYKREEEPEPRGKRGRGAKAKEERRKRAQ
ncbi:MAG: DNA-directed RNA polymerase subunit omega [Candidatus Omnitrophica bacterium]|nr:DNA-directed RNA polymerase subunit omega [Candidatus Omnitrophota bacterium]